MAEKEYIPTHWVNDSEPDIDAEHLNNMEEGIQGLYKPEFDDSGTVEGITSFPAFLEKVVSKMNPITFYKNFKAGMSFILHAGQLVNNGLCNEPGKYPLDAAFGKNLQDQITQQNSNMSDIPKQYAALDKENSFTQAQKIISDSIPALQIISGSTGTSKGTFQITARTDINPYSRAAIDLINNGQINGTLYLHEDGFLRWYAHGNTYKINVTQE
ncbi:hypothetical protein [Enterocloster alcoholdehydrogenati]|uniref:hypothetical protein n=1 Tax=Enterocloster alcoholdehydrogenati TaxID=2547410 RepID=UPI001593D1B9|nr:hypothetical protein [Enterocloster alcoholdehydrogenati]